jgi:hypothetical protein
LLPGLFFRGSASLLLLALTLFEGLPPVCSGATARPDRIWPADGNLRPVTVEGVTDPDDDPVSVTVLTVHQDEPLSKPGQPDASWIGTPQPRVRADRDPEGDGRVYHLRFRSEDTQGGSCTGEVTVCVPAAEGKGCGDGGARVDSTGS